MLAAASPKVKVYTAWPLALVVTFPSVWVAQFTSVPLPKATASPSVPAVASDNSARVTGGCMDCSAVSVARCVARIRASVG